MQRFVRVTAWSVLLVLKSLRRRNSYGVLYNDPLCKVEF